jgi:hypothetical protein
MLLDGKHTILTFTQGGAKYTLLGWVHSEFDMIMLQLIIGEISAANPEVKISYVLDAGRQNTGESLTQYAGRIAMAFNVEMSKLFGGFVLVVPVDPTAPAQYWYEKLWEILKTITLVRDASGTPQIKL